MGADLSGRPFLPAPPVTDEEIGRVAELAAVHARERAYLDGRHENERRALARKQGAELAALAAPRAPEVPSDT